MKQLEFNFEEEKKSVNQLVAEIKNAGEDFEWYPTTQEIVNCLAKKLDEKYINSILDIGCGNGSFFEKLLNAPDKINERGDNLSRFKKATFFGIEKSNILSDEWSERITLLGTDFYQQTLIDKQVEMIFCNPPYSDFEEWATRIIKEGNCRKIALVIPERWKNSERIKSALEKRKWEVEILGNFDFNNAERKARAKVDLLYITPKEVQYRGFSEEGTAVDPFDVWFEETFKIKAEKEKSWRDEDDRKKNLKNEIVESGNTAETLVLFYQKDIEKLYSNYKILENLDSDIFNELKINIDNVKKALKERLQGLKHLYWDMLFERYDAITKRLTHTGRNKVIEKLRDNTCIDFTIENIYQLTMWIIKHSNKLFDEQLTDFFFEICNVDAIHRYKSNKRWNDDEWKYLKDNLEKTKRWYGYDKEEIRKLKNIQLDYRIVSLGHSNFDNSWSGCRMTVECLSFLQDIKVIARNLGFEFDEIRNPKIPDSYSNVNFSYWSNTDFYTTDGELFMNIKLYKNGNRHIKFNKKFMMKLNVEMARINHWINSKEEAMQEMNISEKEMNDIWKSNKLISLENSIKYIC